MSSKPQHKNNSEQATMSLDLLQGYSSDDEDREKLDGDRKDILSPSLSDEDSDDVEVGRRGAAKRYERSLDDDRELSTNSSLPSALDAFNEITGPPEFLNHRVAEPEETREALGVLDRRAKDRSRRERRDLPAGVVVQAKAQLVAIHDRVEGGNPTSTSVAASTGGKRIISATQPDAKDASELLRVCLQCGIPKTYTHSKGMVCPLCGDRPPADNAKEPEKKKGSTVKDKEKIKRMRGQSSHSSWKSETEMQLRQQFD